jgi:hypothetical protein
MKRLDPGSRPGRNKTRAASPPAQTSSESGKHSKTSTAQSNTCSPFKLEKVHSQTWKGEFEFAKQSMPKYDQLQGFVGVFISTLMKFCFPTSCKRGAGWSFIFSIFLMLCALLFELTACSHASLYSPLRNWVYLRSFIYGFSVYLQSQFSFLSFDRETFSAFHSRIWHLYHWIIWLIIVDRLGRSSFFSIMILPEDVSSHLRYVFLSMLSPLCFHSMYELSFIWTAEGADKDVIPASQWFGFNTVLDHVRYVARVGVGEAARARN